MIEYINGNLLDQEGYICHQCNSTGNYYYVMGLSLEIFKKYPAVADIYKSQIEKIPGEIIVIENVINMIGQIHPGKSYKKGDGKTHRIEFFKSCLNKISEHFRDKDQIVKISFPYYIGCGLAGGNWNIYQELIEKFEQENDNLQVYVCKLETLS